ncbi:MAG: ABC transporter permease subunit [Chloroflexi bacterium]|nr:ABC transporter permease subunit [Chloroflexota bacterium]
MKKRSSLVAWLFIIVGTSYFLLPLIATFLFSLRAKKDTLGFTAYQRVFADSSFYETFLFSALMALLTIIASLLLLVPTVYWAYLRHPRLHRLIELVSLMPFVIPPIVLVFGLIKSYSRPPVILVQSRGLLIAGYMVLTLPYMYRAIDAGLRATNVKTLTEAAQSLGAGWPRIIWQVIVPNVRGALVNGAFLTFATVLGELTLAQYLAWPAFGPYLARISQNKAYEPAALTIISFALTWVIFGIVLLVNSKDQQQTQFGGTH